MAREEFPAVGRCIYCDATDGLTEEHSFPAAIDGQIVLPDATCDRCQKITSAFESKLFNTDRLARAALGFNKGRRKTTPKTAEVIALVDGIEKPVRIPIDKHPLPIAFPVFPPPGAAVGRPPVPGLTVEKLAVVSFGQPSADLGDGSKATQIKLEVRTDRDALARMLAKLALAQSVAHLGLDAFEEIFVRGVILGTDPHVGHLVGSYTDAEEPRKGPETGHQCQISWFEATRSDGQVRQVVQAHIHLYAGSPSPGYRVIVGYLRPGFEPAKTKHSIQDVILPRNRGISAV